MPLNVICTGCMKRFQVTDRFAGMKGPCPKCGAIISIPTESLHLQEDNFVNPVKGKKNKGLLRPFLRIDAQFDPVRTRNYALIVLGVLLATFLLGCVPMYTVLRSLLGTLGLCLIAFPLAIFGYTFVRDREQIFFFSGEELYRRAGIVAAGYVILWLLLEGFLATTRADFCVSWFYFSVLAALASLLTLWLLELRFRDAFLHYCIFGFSVILLRYLLGFGWFWLSGELIRHSAAPPPPLLPGM